MVKKLLVHIFTIYSVHQTKLLFEIPNFGLCFYHIITQQKNRTIQSLYCIAFEYKICITLKTAFSDSLTNEFRQNVASGAERHVL